MNDDPRERLTPYQKELFAQAHRLGQDFVADDAFAKRFKALVNQAKQTFARDGEHSHMLVSYLRDEKTKKMVIIPAMFADWPPPEGKKEATLMGLGVKLAEANKGHTLVMLAHLSEGWAAKQSNFEKSDKQYIADMDAAERIEVLITSLTTQDLRQSYQTWRINRDAKGKFNGWNKKPELSVLYKPDSDFHPLATGDFIPHAVIKGYVAARSREWERGEL